MRPPAAVPVPKPCAEASSKILMLDLMYDAPAPAHRCQPPFHGSQAEWIEQRGPRSGACPSSVHQATESRPEAGRTPPLGAADHLAGASPAMVCSTITRIDRATGTVVHTSKQQIWPHPLAARFRAAKDATLVSTTRRHLPFRRASAGQMGRFGEQRFYNWCSQPANTFRDMVAKTAPAASTPGGEVRKPASAPSPRQCGRSQRPSAGGRYVCLLRQAVSRRNAATCPEELEQLDGLAPAPAAAA